MPYCKVSFHGPGQGYGEYMRRMDEAGIRFSAKFVDNAGAAAEAASLAQASGLNHQILYRMTAPGNLPQDLPDYSLSPAAAATEYWQQVSLGLSRSPELTPHKSRIWIETVNEPRTQYDHDNPNWGNMHPVDWLGNFGQALAVQANNAGWKICLFGMNAGTPELEDWSLPFMKQFLLYCNQNREVCAISLHEGKTTPNANIEDPYSNWYAHMVGRFVHLHYACANMGIDMPTTFISELAQVHNDIPSPARFRSDVVWYNVLVSAFPRIRGVFLWTLGPGDWGNLPEEMEQHVNWLTDYAIQQGPEQAPESCQPRVSYNRTYRVIPSTATEAQAIGIFVKAWREGRQTVGGSYDDACYGPGVNRTAIMHGIQSNSHSAYLDWVNQHYPGTTVVFEDTPTSPPPPQGTMPPAGIHFPADPHFVTTNDIPILQAARGTHMKIMTTHAPQMFTPFMDGVSNIVLRIFQEWGNRNITPQEFVEWNWPDVVRAIAAIPRTKAVWLEYHNEPNLVGEGLERSWNNGEQFGAWVSQARSLMRSKLQSAGITSGVYHMFPGLSPGASVPGVRRDDKTFLAEARNHLVGFEAIGVHAYWSHTAPMADAVQHVRNTMTLAGLPIGFVTEASHNTRHTTPELKAQAYIQFLKQVGTIPSIRGVAFFVLSATRPEYSWSTGSGETWTPGMASIFGAR